MEEDKNLQRASKSAEAAVMQDRIKEYQTKIEALKMNGAMQLLGVEINQGYYETSSKSQLERAFLICFSNIKGAIDSEMNALREQLQQEVMRFQASSMNL